MQNESIRIDAQYALDQLRPLLKSDCVGPRTIDRVQRAIDAVERIIEACTQEED